MQELWRNSTFVGNGTISVVYISYGGVLEICYFEFFFYETELSLKAGDTRIDPAIINKVKYSDFQ